MAPRALRTSRRRRRLAGCLALAWTLVLASAAPVSAGVVASPSALQVAEGGATATYQLSLSSEPRGDVTVEFVVDSQVWPIWPVTFTPADWNLPRTIEVTAWDDYVDEPDLTTSTIVHEATYADGSVYESGAAPISVTTADNDVASVQVAQVDRNNLDSEPEGGYVEWSVALTSEPTAPVTVTLSPDEQGTMPQTTVLFTPETWSTAVVLRHDITDDDIAEGQHAAELGTTVDSADPLYAGYPVPRIGAPIHDNGEAVGVAFAPGSPKAVQVVEGGASSSYSIRLTSQPLADVLVDVSSLTGESYPTPSQLLFTPASWSTAQSVSVTATADVIPEPSPHRDAMVHAISSFDRAYDAATFADVPVAVIDDDSPAFVVTDPLDRSMREADSAGTERTIAIRLSTRPLGTVQVVAMSDGQVQLQQYASVSFDASNWNVDQYLRVRAADDLVAEAQVHPGTLSISVTATDDPGYAALTIEPRTFDIEDDDYLRATVTCVDGPNWNRTPDGLVELAEEADEPANQVGCYLYLGTPPTERVQVGTQVLEAQATVDRPLVTFEPGQRGPELIVFTGSDDVVVEGDPHAATAVFSVETSDPGYMNATVEPVQFAVSERERAGLRFTPDSATLEEGAGATELSVTLTSRPRTTVSVSLAHGPQVELLAPSGGSMLFSPTDWDVPRRVRLAAVDDAITEPSPIQEQLTASITTSDLVYAALTVPPVPISVIDNDTPGVVVNHSDGGTAAAEGGVPDRFTVRLATRPTATVTVTMAPDEQVIATPAELTFAPDAWNVSQEVTVLAVQDDLREGDHVGYVGLPLRSDDPGYAAGSPAEPAAVAVAIADDEAPGATITESAGSTGLIEGGGADTYTIVVNARPSADVVVRPDGGTQATVEPAVLTFTPSTWNIPQTVTASAVQDDVDEADQHAVPITHAVETTAAGWAGVTLATVAAKVTDDDTAAVVVTQSEGTTRVVEGAKQADSITLRLASQPTANVTITPKPDAQITVGAKPLVFTPASWKDPLEVSVRAANDDEKEGDHTGRLAFSIASTDGTYAKVVIADIVVDVVDDEGEVTIMPGDDGGGDTSGQDPSTHSPRGTKPAGDGSDGGGRGGSTDRRTAAGQQRTREGAERTDEGLGVLAGRRGRSGSRPEAKPPVVAAPPEPVAELTAKPKERRAKPKGPGVVEQAAKWAKRNWNTIAPVAGMGLMAAGAGTFLLHGDPIKSAQRGLSQQLPGSGGSPGEERSDGRRRRGFGKKRRKDDGDGDDLTLPGTDS